MAIDRRKLLEWHACFSADFRQVPTSEVALELVTLASDPGPQDVPGVERAAYGEQIVTALRTQLSADYGRGFTRTNLSYVMRVAEFFPDEHIVHAVCGQLFWTHFRELIDIDDPLKRESQAEAADATPQIERPRKSPRPRKKRR